MITRTFEIVKGGKLIATRELEMRTTWEDLSLKHFIAYTEIIRRRDKFQESIDKGTTEQTEEELEVEAEVFFADMIVVLTGLPKELVYSMSPNMIEVLYKELDFDAEKLPKETDTCSEFWFRSASLDKIRIWENDLKKRGKFFQLKKNLKKKAKLQTELMVMKKSHFTLRSQVDEMSLQQWINSNSVLKKIKAIQEQLKYQDFSNYAQLIAYIVDKNGKRIHDMKKLKELGKVFEDLPFVTAYKIVNFFLNAQSVLSANTKHYLEHLYQTMKNPKQEKKKL